MTEFTAGERHWIERLGTLRNVIRQELIARQIAPLVQEGMTVLDVGCGQGTQALRLATAGCHVTGVDPSLELLGLCAEGAAAEHLDVELLHGRIDDLGALCPGRRFDLVCCHGVMMYLEDRAPAVRTLAERVADDGRLSVTFRNGHALAMRPGLRGEWTAALAAFDATTYVNELGLEATADRIQSIETMLSAARLDMVACYGVRVFNDAISTDVAPPGGEELQRLLDAEERAGAMEPYKWTASQLHVIAEVAPE